MVAQWLEHVCVVAQVVGGQGGQPKCPWLKECIKQNIICHIIIIK